MKLILGLLMGLGVVYGQDNTHVDRFFEQYFRFKPTEGTAAGLHQYDTLLENPSTANRKAQIEFLRAAEKEFAAEPESIDRDLLLTHIRGDLLDIEQVRMWEKNPDDYTSNMTNAVFLLMSRTFAPPEARLKSVIAREKLMPAVLETARENLKNPPRIYTEVAIEQMPGIVGFFERDVPAAFAKVTDAALLKEFGEANEHAVEALRAYEKWLKTDLLARSHGDFRLGAELYAKKLEYNEMVTTPLDELLKEGYEDMRRNQRTFQEVAAKVDAKKTPMEIMAELAHDHPMPGGLLDAFRNTLGGLRDFIDAHHIVTIPSQVLPIVEETPPFMRALTSASMDTPGPYESVAKEAFFNVTLPEPGWSKEAVEEHMEGFNRGTVVSTAVHEVYPGHYTQFLWVKQAPSKVRKLFGCGSNAEGWAHYTEQMMLDEGYGNGDPKLRLGQLQDALLRNARYIVGIEMHTGKMTFEQAADFFVKEGYQSRVNAVRETKRGTSDPTYLVYTLGKLQIMQLRADYRKKMGAAFRLQEFHDAFLKQGFPPVALVRRALLGE
ncbi:MAG TPA: DUF885 domain-containing protein [Bryobacteraceae bacterium]|nr:DUF885 domain-containing protein [Bryobacteraceae bacterium]